VLVERSFSTAETLIGTAALVAVKVGARTRGCGSSLTRCGRHTGPRLPCPPHGEHASIGVRQYRARPFFASASPAPLPRSLFDQHEPSVLAHPPRSPWAVENQATAGKGRPSDFVSPFDSLASETDAATA